MIGDIPKIVQHHTAKHVSVVWETLKLFQSELLSYFFLGENTGIFLTTRSVDYRLTTPRHIIYSNGHVISILMTLMLTCGQLLKKNVHFHLEELGAYAHTYIHSYTDLYI